MASANPEGPAENVTTLKRNADLKLADVFVTDAQVSGIIDYHVFEKKKKKTRYSYVVFVTWSDGKTTTVWRSYNTIFMFQVDLLRKFPEAAGEKADKDGYRKRIIPYLPGKKLFTRSDAKLASQREPQIAEWVQKMVKLPEKVSRSEFVVDFFRIKESDPTYKKELTEMADQPSEPTNDVTDPKNGATANGDVEPAAAAAVSIEGLTVNMVNTAPEEPSAHQVSSTVAEVFVNEGRVESPENPATPTEDANTEPEPDPNQGSEATEEEDRAEESTTDNQENQDDDAAVASSTRDEPTTMTGEPSTDEVSTEKKDETLEASTEDNATTEKDD
eukprot:scpid56376/ scgid24272/ SH3 and PX domain-containing protein 2B; Adapter protein HOFI; Factor for adipocyte differentiation 49; Tyrosine kinase substrate with four SH3 domains